jgi:hypothetical protein
MPQISRRAALAAPLALWPARLLAQDGIGTTTRLVGSGRLVHGGAQVPLAVGAMLAEGDRVRIGAAAVAQLKLNTDTFINMGPETEVTIDRYLADVGGTITLGGAIVFDRDDGLPPVDLAFQTEFGQIGVRGTRFFFGPSKGIAGTVFVDRGQVTVTNAGVTRRLRAGDGVDMVAGGPPSEVAQWKAPRIEAAFALVGLQRG